jgi:hypothetical protein
MQSEETRQRERVVTATTDLARTGRFAGWREIEAQLLADGHAQATAVLFSPVRRSIVDRLCRLHHRDSKVRAVT